MTDLDAILNGYVPIEYQPAIKQDIKVYFTALVSRYAKDQQLVKQLKQVITKL